MIRNVLVIISAFSFIFNSCQSLVLSATTTNPPKASTGSGFGGTATGGGFGTKKVNSKQSLSGKVRNVSGFTGSGTKTLRTAVNTFDSIVKDYDKESVSDMYVRSPLNDKELYWFVGKICRRTDINDKKLKGTSIPTEFEAVISQKRLILEYAKNKLRPQNFGGPYANNLEIWLAPGDTEMEVVQNKIQLTKVTGSLANLSDSAFSVADVGFNPEIYVGDEIKEGGLRVKRDDNGKPMKPIFGINEAKA